MTPEKDTFAIVTAAYNEELYIEALLRSVTAQSHLPERWVVVSDGSTDRTDEIVRQYAAQHKFIQLHRMRRFTQSTPDLRFCNRFLPRTSAI
jgi:glycosyltransferase involved in cell wall biosynthesis